MFLILSAILLIYSFPNFNLNFLVFIAFVPLFFALQNKSPKGAFLIAYFCGFLFYLGTLYWLYHVTIVGLIVLCLYLALYFGLFGFLLKLTTSHYPLFTIPAVWVLLEFLQSRAFTGFGWTLLGYSQYRNLPFIQIADFSGVYGVSFVIIMVNVAIYRLFKKSVKEIFIVAIVIIIVLGYGLVRRQEPGARSQKLGIKVSVIQGNIPQEAKWDPAAADAILMQYSNLTKDAALDGPDLIIWPETSFPGFLVSDRKLTARVLDLVKEVKIPLLLGANTEKGLKSFNSAVLISESGRIVDKHDKIHLVPFGEYVPFSDKIPFLHNLILGQLGEFTPGGHFKIFSLQPSAFSQAHKFSALICYEDIFPELARRFVQNGAQFLVVITNDAWYGKSGAPYQHAACSVFRAIENRVPVVRCANTGYSCFIDSTGRIYDSVEQNGTHLFITGYKTSLLTLK